MKVLFLNVTCNSGSTGKIAYAICKKLNEDNHKAIIAYGRRGKTNVQNAVSISSNIEVYIHAMSTRVTGLVGCFSLKATHNFLGLMEKFQPDIVHIHEIHGYYINIIPVIKFLKNKNIPIVWTFHCEFMYTGKCGYAFECNNWKYECGNCSKLREYPKSMFWDFTKTMLKKKKEILQDYANVKIVTPSLWLKNRVEQSYLKDREILVVRNGIDLDNIFYPRNEESKRKEMGLVNEKIVLSVAENIMHERKGGAFILELAKKMSDVTFIMIGVDKKTNINMKNVIMLERTYDQNELAEFYSMADVFVICSSLENFPTTCIEALACGTSVCGFDAGGSRETVPMNLGDFVPYGNIAKLQVVIEKQIKNVDKEKRTQCRKYAVEHYSIQNMYQHYLDIYNSFIE